jgi:hypothetical protein
MEDYGIPVVYLLRGILHQNQENAWRLLLQHRHKIKDYLSAIGLDLHVNEADGYAFTKQREMPDELDEFYPKLMQKRPLGYLPSLICVLLRKRLLESDQTGSETRVIISREQIIELVRVFQSDSDTNEKKQEDKVDGAVKKLVEYGFLLELKSEKFKYEISRVLNAYIDITRLKEIQDRLKQHTSQDNQEPDINGTLQ